jgi:hypothetical protein
MLQKMCSIHVTRQKRNPHSYKLTTGKPGHHIQGVLRSIERGLSIPVVCFNQMDTEDWFRMSFDAGEIVRQYKPKSSAEGPSPVTLNTTYRKSGSSYKGYQTLRINYASCDLKWEQVLEPEFPVELFEG